MNKKKVEKKTAVKILSVILVIAVVIGLAVAVFSPKKKKETSGYVVGYLPDYASEAAKRVDFSALTHLNIAFANPTAEGKLYLEMSDDSIKNVVKKCHDNDVKAILSLGGGSISSTNYNAIMRGNAQGIKNFNTQIMDWMLALRKQCNKHDLLLTAAVATWYSDNITKKAMDCFDYVMVMAYDNDGDRENHSKYEYAVSEMKHYENCGIDKKKLILGVPFYGYKYTSSGAMDWNSGASYRTILSGNSAAKNSDYADGYAYNGKETIRKKAELSKQYGGIMIWELSQDADGADSLLKVIKGVYQ